MRVFQHALETALGEIPATLVAVLVREKLEGEGIVLSESEIDALANQLADCPTEPLELEGRSLGRPAEFQVRLTEDDGLVLAERSDRIVKSIPRLIPEVVDELVPSLLETLKEQWPDEQRVQNRASVDFESNLRDEWSEPLWRLEMLIAIAREAGQEAYGDLSSEYLSSYPCMSEIMVRLQARSCQVASEILTLLRAGYSDGAMARWRTLHEIAVTACLIGETGEDTAERYKLHEAMEARRAARDYTDCCERLDYEPLSAGELHEAETRWSELTERYGRPFRESYGWAAEILQTRNPTFRDIERHASLGHLRAHFRMASHNVHANPKGVFFKLGLLDNDDFLLTGPTRVGLADPGQVTAISLVQACSSLLNLRPSMDELVTMKLMLVLSNEVEESFANVQAENNVSY